MVISKLTRPIAALLLVVSMLAFSLPGAATAAGSTGGDGLRVSPVRSDITISPGQSQIVNVTVTNVQTVSTSLQAIINDFTASSDESGNPAIIVNPNQYAQTNSLKRFVQPITDTITVPAGSSIVVPVTINVPANAVGGGYFGLVRFSPAGNGIETGKNLSLAGSVGSLILLTVPGNIVNKVTIASFDTRVNDSPRSLFYSSKNIDGVVRFQNEGNVQEQPFGKILLKNHSGKVLSSIEVNNTNPRSDVLPNSIRKFTLPLNHIGSFGIYTIEGNFGYGNNGQLLSAATTFYVVPTFIIILFIAIVILLLFFIFVVPKLVRQYNRRVIARASRSRDH